MSKINIDFLKSIGTNKHKRVLVPIRITQGLKVAIENLAEKQSKVLGHNVSFNDFVTDALADKVKEEVLYMNDYENYQKNDISDIIKDVQYKLISLNKYIVKFDKVKAK